MKPISSFSIAIRFFTGKHMRLLYLIILSILSVAALKNAADSDTIRRTFVFYNMKDYTPQAEEHMLLRSRSEEASLTRYVEETLFGPRNPESAPLFPRGTKLLSLFYRDGVVYIDLSEAAALPVVIENIRAVPVEGGVKRGFSTFRKSLARNFPFVKEIKFFIEGYSIDF
ncbi:MAG: GerMN domain-containing protein [Treponema sp.]|jgi:hypothetical protein|nr:GerMN domain-containing protein [Treponema sp.]